jgi:hypothetical protein
MNKNQDKSTLWTFGCSFTDDLERMTLIDEKIRNNSNHNRAEFTFPRYKDLKGYVPNSWPTLLSEKLDMNLKNKGRGGSSNATIFHEIMKQFEFMNQNDMVIYQFSNVTRFRWADDKNNEFKDICVSFPYSNIDSHLNLSSQTKDEIHYNLSKKSWLDDIKVQLDFLKEICQIKKINFFYWTSCGEIWNFLKDIEDQSNHIELYSNSWVFADLLNYPKSTIRDETDGQINDIHMGEFGHIKQSESFYNFIKSKI